MNQFIGHRNQIDFSFVLKLIEALNVYNMYITLFTNDTCSLSLICFFGFTVDNGGSQQTERISKIHDEFILTNAVYSSIIHSVCIAIIYIINVANIKMYRSLDNLANRCQFVSCGMI